MIDNLEIGETDIKRLFSEQLDSVVECIVPLYGGRSYVGRIITNNGDFVLKQYRKDISFDIVTTERSICNFLNESGISTPIYFDVGLIKDRCYSIQSFIPGCVFDNHKAPEWVLFASGKLLCSLRSQLKRYPANTTRWAPGWPSNKDYEDALQELDKLKIKARNSVDGVSRQIIEDIDYKVSLINSLTHNDVVDTRKLSYVNTHGDYSVRQNIVDLKENRLSVIDFESFCRMPAVWEIIRSYTYASKECINASFNEDSFRKYVDDTDLASELNDYDYSHFLHFYAVQLLLNTYGYTEFFNEETSDKQNYISFGMWRTRLLRELMILIEG